MRKIICLFVLLCQVLIVSAQELNCVLTINAEQTGKQNLQLFKTLENALTEFINTKRWTANVVSPEERINCSMMLTISGMDGNAFVASLQVQSSRTIFNSTYSSPLLNFNDKHANFEYTEFESLRLNPNQFGSNLVSVISFYAYVILGLDADTFSEKGGSKYYNQAKNITNVAQSSGYKGWNFTDGNQTRYNLIDQLQSPSYVLYRNILYSYHRNALDEMSASPKKAKSRVVLAINQFKKLNTLKPNSLIQRLFFDAKADEILSVFSGGPTVKITELVDVLNKVSPNNASKWGKIKY